jgi:hypothetical protein
MPNRSSKRPRDINSLAKFITDVATGAIEPGKSAAPNQRKGGLKGGKRRAQTLTPEQLSEIARLGAQARWKKKT